MAKIATKTIKDGAVQFSFMNGTELEASLAALPRDIVNQLALHGLSQKIGDSYASAESIEEAVASASAVYGNLKSGLWATRSVKGGKVVEALAASTGKPYDECLEYWSGLSDKQKAELKKHSAIKAEIAKIDAERARIAAEAASDDDAPDLMSLFD